MSRIHFTFKRQCPLNYISHLDTLRLFHRALRRSSLPLAYSQGYSPHPKFNLAVPLPLGVTAEDEHGELYFKTIVSPQQFIAALRTQLPTELELSSAAKVNLDVPALPAQVTAVLYRATLTDNTVHSVYPDQLQAALDRLMSEVEILVERKNKKKQIHFVNIRPSILDLQLNHNANQLLQISMKLAAGSQGGASPGIVLEKIMNRYGTSASPVYNWSLHREKIYFGEHTD